MNRKYVIVPLFVLELFFASCSGPDEKQTSADSEEKLKSADSGGKLTSADGELATARVRTLSIQQPDLVEKFSNQAIASTDIALTNHAYPEYPDSGVHIGQGWDSFSSTGTTASCIEAEEIPLEQRSFKTNAREVKSSLSLFKNKSLAIAASYSGATGSASASFDREQSHALDVDKLHFLFEFDSQASSTFAVPKGTVSSALSDPAFQALLKSTTNDQVQNRLIDLYSAAPQYSGQVFQLTKVARGLFESDVKEFNKVCGQGFVSAIYRGSKINLLLSSESVKQEDKEKLRAQVKAKGYGAKLSVTATSEEEKTLATQSISTEVFQEGGYPIAPPRNVGELSAFFENVDAMLDRPNAYRIRITSYEELLLPRSSWAKPLPPELKELTDYYLVIKDVHRFALDMYAGLMKVKGRGPPPKDTNFIGIIADAYSPTGNGEAYMRDLADEIALHRSFVEKMLDSCYASLETCGDFSALLTRVNAKIKEAYANHLAAAEQTLVKDVTDEFQQEVVSELVRLSNTTVAANDPTGPAILAQGESVNAFVNANKEKPLPGLLEDLGELAKSLTMPGGSDIVEMVEVGEYVVEDTKARYERFKDVLGVYQSIDTSAELQTTFYPQIYDFLARIPISGANYELGLLTSSAVTTRTWKHGKYRKTEVKTTTSGKLSDQQKLMIESPGAVLQDVIIAERLLPWAKYFCSEKISNSLCLELASLERIADVPINEEAIKSLLKGNLAYQKIDYSYYKKRRGGIHRL